MTYTDYKNQSQKTVNELPIYFAYGPKQFNEMLEELNMTFEQAKKELYGTGSGGYYKRSDAELINATFEKIADDLDELIKADTTGDGFIYDMFLCELADHEYIITGDLFETLNAVGITPEELEKNPALMHGLNKAKAEILNNDY